MRRLLSVVVCFVTFFSVRKTCAENSDLPYTQEQYDAFAAEQFPDTEHLQSIYDFIIVGAGSAGCALAHRLSEINDWEILLIEAGDSENISEDIPSSGTKLQRSGIDWKFDTVPSRNYGSALNNRQLFVPRGKVVGGSSVINEMIYTRGNRRNYDTWFDEGDMNWSWNTVQYYFKKLENYTVDPTNNNFGHSGPMTVENVTYRTEFAAAYVQAAAEAGSPTINLNLENAGTSYLQANTRNGYRLSNNRAYLIPIRNRKNLSLKKLCHVTKLGFRMPKHQTPIAESVSFICNNNTFAVKARKEIILSAGAVGSPQILMLSGIGPYEELSKLGIQVIKDLPVGRNLQDHVFPAGLTFTINKAPHPTAGENEEFRNNQTGPLTIPGDIEVYAYTLPKHGVPSIEYMIPDNSILNYLPYATNIWNLNLTIYDEVYKPFANQTAYSVFPILQGPKSRGWIKLRDSNPFSKPLIFHDFFSHPDDVEKILAGIKGSIAISRQPALQKWGAQVFSKSLPMCAQFEFGSDDYWRCHIKALPCTTDHVCCTNKMGSWMEETAVVSPNLRVHGIRNLRVIDASIMPEIPNGHLNGPSTMIGEYGAHIIKADYRRNDF